MALARTRLACWDERISHNASRGGFAWAIQKSNDLEAFLYFPPSTWCGMPTGCRCDECTSTPAEAVCTFCDDIYMSCSGCGMQARSIILRRSSCPSAPCSDSVIGLQHMLFNAFTASTVDGTAVNARASPRVGAWVPAGFPCTIAPCVGFPGNTASRFNQFCNPRRIPVQVWSMPATGCFTRPWTLAFALFFYRLAPLGLGVTRAVMPRLVDTRAFGRSTMVASSFIMCVSTARERLGK